MRVVVPAETIPGEHRVSVTPETVRLMCRAGLEVVVQSGAGQHAGISDAALREAGAQVVRTIRADSVDVLLHVRPIHPRLPSRLRPGAITIGLLSPGADLGLAQGLRDSNVTSFALELLPRTARAQPMDALTSQALVSGYRCVLEAAIRLPRLFPMLMTAAGTIPPARVLVLGAGVAGLHALGTAVRLGGKVSGYDVRASSADEIRSMGATFVDLGMQPRGGEGGYAREMTEAYAAELRLRLAPHVAACDVVITTAFVPGKPAPLLLTSDMVAGMRHGSVVVDLAAEAGGNVEGSVPGEDVLIDCVDGGHVVLVGMEDAASSVAADASRLYAKNVANLLLAMTANGVVAPNLSDDVIAAACFTHDGVLRHEPTAALVGARTPVVEPEPEQEPEPEPGPEQTVEPEPEPEPDAEAESEPKADGQAEPRVEPDAEPEAAPEQVKGEEAGPAGTTEESEPPASPESAADPTPADEPSPPAEPDQPLPTADEPAAKPPADDEPDTPPTEERAKESRPTRPTPAAQETLPLPVESVGDQTRDAAAPVPPAEAPIAPQPAAEPAAPEVPAAAQEPRAAQAPTKPRSHWAEESS